MVLDRDGKIHFHEDLISLLKFKVLNKEFISSFNLIAFFFCKLLLMPKKLMHTPITANTECNRNHQFIKFYVVLYSFLF